jgi:hypothetical protein
MGALSGYDRLGEAADETPPAGHGPLPPRGAPADDLAVLDHVFAGGLFLPGYAL